MWEGGLHLGPVALKLPRRFASLGWYHAHCSEPIAHVAVVVLAVELRVR
jgi:hypothetical protein